MCLATERDPWGVAVTRIPFHCSDIVDLDAYLKGSGGGFNDEVNKYQFKDSEINCSFSIIPRRCGMWK